MARSCACRATPSPPAMLPRKTDRPVHPPPPALPLATGARALARARPPRSPTIDKRELAAFSSRAAATAMTAAAADPPAGTGRSDARPSRSALIRSSGPCASVVADLSLAPGDELAQLLVDARVDAGVGVLLEHLLPAGRGDDVSGLRAHAIPSVEVLGR